MFKRLMACFIVALLAGCTHLQSQVEYDEKADFSKLETYELSREDSARLNEEALRIDERIRETIVQELENAGYLPEVSGNPDFLVYYSVKTKDTTHTLSLDRESYYSGSEKNDALTPTHSSIQEFTQGTLVIKMLEPKTNDIFWTGQSKTDVYDYSLMSQTLRSAQLAV